MAPPLGSLILHRLIWVKSLKIPCMAVEDTVAFDIMYESRHS